MKTGNDFRYAEAVSLFGSDFGTWRTIFGKNHPMAVVTHRIGGWNTK